MAELHILPCWMESAGMFLTAHRCDKCWMEALRDTRVITAALTKDTRQDFCEFLDRQDCTDLANILRQVFLLEAPARILEILDQIEAGESLFHA
ncbi:MAG: hypothetical protein GY731_16240 [Gammaproteobacteria bacterium]|nr:hypothetical protein [Gammaproteobacteria bacterium]